MRSKDENKRKAISESAIKLINRLGFEGVSMSKIAQDANVSPATIYIYFENKEDMINKLYTEAKYEMSLGITKGVSFEDFSNIKSLYRKLWFNLWNFCVDNPEKLEFTEQFVNSPHINQVNKEEGQKHYFNIYNLFAQGIKNEVIKDLPISIILSFVLTPLQQMVRSHIRQEFIMTQEYLEKAFNVSWDAIKI